MIRLWQSITAVALGLVSLGCGEARATVITWNTTSATSITGTTAGLTFNSTAGSQTLKARAYATANADGTGGILARNLGIYSGGLGVNNCPATTDCTAPEHAVDNVGKDDIILFEFPVSTFSPKDLSIGWFSGDSDIQVWIGGPTTSGFDLGGSGVCTAACQGATTATKFASLGFTNLGTLNNVPLNTPTSLNTTLTGNYMIVTAALGTDGLANDYFKVSQIRVNQVTSAPEPLTIALFGAGLIGLGLARRRRAGV
jgi:hypothetical protein